MRQQLFLRNTHVSYMVERDKYWWELIALSRSDEVIGLMVNCDSSNRCRVHLVDY